jgi:hypothetical protein
MFEVRIRSEKYGKAIAMLLRGGEGFQTRFERTALVNSNQYRALDEAGLVAKNGNEPKTRKPRAEKAR